MASWQSRRQAYFTSSSTQSTPSSLSKRPRILSPFESPKLPLNLFETWIFSTPPTSPPAPAHVVVNMAGTTAATSKPKRQYNRRKPERTISYSKLLRLYLLGYVIWFNLTQQPHQQQQQQQQPRQQQQQHLQQRRSIVDNNRVDQIKAWVADLFDGTYFGVRLYEESKQDYIDRMTVNLRTNTLCLPVNKTFIITQPHFYKKYLKHPVV